MTRRPTLPSDVTKFLVEARRAAVHAARTSSAAFTAFVMVDEGGRPFQNAPFHQEWHALLATYDRLILEGSAECGKCEAAGARLALYDGTHVPIEELCGTETSLLLLDPETMESRTARARVTDNGVRPIYEVRLKSGRTLRLTAEHPLYRAQGWTQVQAIRAGDFVAAARTLPAPSGPPEISPDTAEMLGYLIGDGGCSTPSRVGFTNADPLTLDRLADLAGRRGWKMRKTSGKYGYALTLATGIGPRRDKKIEAPAAFARRFGIDCLAIRKRVPRSLFRTSNEAIAAFLGAYFACDGTAGKKPALEWSSSSEGMLEDVQLLLLRLGITSRVRERMATCNGKRFRTWRLFIGGWENIERFRALVPVWSTLKRGRLTGYTKPTKLTVFDGVPAAWQDMLPRPVGSTTRQRARLGHAGRASHNREAVRRVLEKIPCLEVGRLCSDAIYWDQVESIELREAVQTYAVEVDDPAHCYLSSGVLSHNTLQIVGWIAWLLGCDPTLRIVLASKNKDKAAQLLSLLVKVMHSPRYREVFPDAVVLGHNVHTLRMLGWDGRNPSVQAYQFKAPITGNRVDVLVFDDILDEMNTRTEEQRAEYLNFYRNTYISRLTWRGRVVFISNAWHPRDLLHQLRKERIWHCRRYPIWWPAPGEPLEPGACEDVDLGQGPVRMRSLWPKQWPIARIVGRRAEFAGAIRFFERVYECRPLDDSASSWDRAWIARAEELGRGLPWVRSLHEAFNERFRTISIGVDLATARPAARRKTDESAFSMLGQTHEGRVRLLRVESGRLTGPNIVSRIKDLRGRFHPAIPWVETNAAQIFIAQFCEVQTVNAFGQVEDPIAVRCFETTAQAKYDPRLGVEAMGTEMAGGLWLLPNMPGVPPDPEYARLVDEMMAYDPHGHAGDRLMATWIAWEGLRLGRGQQARVLGGNAAGR